MTKRVETGGGAHIGGDVTAVGDVVGRDQYKVILGGPGTVPSTDPAEYLTALIGHPHYRPWAHRYVPLAGAITEAQTTPDWEPIAPALMLLESAGEGPAPGETGATGRHPGGGGAP